MADDKDLIEFDDSEAVKFIYEQLGEEQQKRISEDDIQYVLDLVCEYYDENGLMDDETVDEAEIAEDDILQFVAELAKKEKVVNLSEDDIRDILNGEFEYGNSIGIYSEDIDD